VRLAASPALLFLHAVAGQFIFGLVLALPGTLFGIPSWTTAVRCDVAAQANLLAVFFLGQLICSAVAGDLVDRFGADRILMAGAAVLVFAFLLLARATGPGGAALAMTLLASGGSAINASSCTLVSVTFGERRGAMLSLMGIATAVGAVVTPLLLQAGNWPTADRLHFIAGIAAAIAMAPLAVARAPRTSTGTSLVAMLSLARDRALIVLITLTAIEFGVEAVIAGWSAAYVLAVMPTISGGAVIATYWGGLAAGRTVGPLVLARRSKAGTVGLGALFAAIGIALVALSRSPVGLLAGVVIAGVALGPLAPTLISVAGDRYPNRTGLAIGALISLAQIGGVTLPWLTGRAAISVGFRGAMLVPTVSALMLLAGAVTIRARDGR
jgi:MFS transporter, FHS family, L-fucose permease